MTLRELLERERDRAAASIAPDVLPGMSAVSEYGQACVKRGFNHALELLMPVVEALEKYRGQASAQQKGPSFYSEADEAIAELDAKLGEGK